MKVFHISANKFDVFYNTGWEYWARFEIQDKKLKQVSGTTIPKNIQLFLEKRYQA